MRENLKSGSMRGGWRGEPPWFGDLSTGGKPSENARQPTETAGPVAYSTTGSAGPLQVDHMPTAGCCYYGIVLPALLFNTHTGQRRRVFIITTIQTPRPTLLYVYQFYPGKT
jgi:hypothetical protein